MKTRRFGPGDSPVSEVGLGTWQLGSDCRGDLGDGAAREILEHALAGGVTCIDTADVYGNGLSEERIGRFLKDRSAKLFVATKLGRGGGLHPDGYALEGLHEAPRTFYAEEEIERRIRGPY